MIQEAIPVEVRKNEKGKLTFYYINEYHGYDELQSLNDILHWYIVYGQCML